jgi:hypothetical protein
MKAVIDRLEGDLAVVLCGEKEIKIDVPRVLLPENAGEGDWIKISFELDPEETEKRRERVQGLLDRLKKK